MTRIIILAALIISFIIGFADGITGFMMVAAFGSGFMAARSGPAALLGAGFLIFAYWIAISDNARYDGTKPAGIFRRAVAYMVDLSIGLAIIPPVLAVPLLLVESSLTGSFVWEFNRTDTSILRTRSPEARRRRVAAYSVSRLSTSKRKIECRWAAR